MLIPHHSICSDQNSSCDLQIHFFSVISTTNLKLIWKEVLLDPPADYPPAFFFFFQIITSYHSFAPTMVWATTLSYVLLLKSPCNWPFCFCPCSLMICYQCSIQRYPFKTHWVISLHCTVKIKVFMRDYNVLQDLLLLWPCPLFTLPLTMVASFLLLKHIR